MVRSKPPWGSRSEDYLYLIEAKIKIPPEAPSAKPRVQTPSTKIEFYVEKLKPLGEELPLYKEPLEIGRVPLAEKYPLVFVQVHSKFRNHSSFARVPWQKCYQPKCQRAKLLIATDIGATLR
ncbi:hypothetical protein ACFLVW_06835 [Chloroflexota bacterium]